MRRKTLRSQGEDRVPGRRDQIRIHSAGSAEGRPNDRGGERTVNELFPDLMAESAEIRFLLTTAYMGICAVQDFKSRRISLPLTACAGCAAIVLDLPVIAGRGNGVLLMTAGLLPGALLLLLSAALLARWEITFYLHPERFSENTNDYLRCQNCTEKLCAHKKQLKTLWVQIAEFTARKKQQLLK